MTRLHFSMPARESSANRESNPVEEEELLHAFREGLCGARGRAVPELVAEQVRAVFHRWATVWCRRKHVREPYRTDFPDWFPGWPYEDRGWRFICRYDPERGMSLAVWVKHFGIKNAYREYRRRHRTEAALPDSEVPDPVDPAPCSRSAELPEIIIKARRILSTWRNGPPSYALLILRCASAFLEAMEGPLSRKSDFRIERGLVEELCGRPWKEIARQIEDLLSRGRMARKEGTAMPSELGWHGELGWEYVLGFVDPKWHLNAAKARQWLCRFRWLLEQDC